MSRKDNCSDNAVAESFLKDLKTEIIYENILVNRQKTEKNLFEYIELWYNKKRRHSHLGYLTIEEFNQSMNYTNAA